MLQEVVERLATAWGQSVDGARERAKDGVVREVDVLLEHEVRDRTLRPAEVNVVRSRLSESFRLPLP